MGAMDLGSMERSSRIRPTSVSCSSSIHGGRRKKKVSREKREPELELGKGWERPGRREQPEKGDISSSPAGIRERPERRSVSAWATVQRRSPIGCAMSQLARTPRMAGAWRSLAGIDTGLAVIHAVLAGKEAPV